MAECINKWKSFELGKQLWKKLDRKTLQGSESTSFIPRWIGFLLEQLGSLQLFEFHVCAKLCKRLITKKNMLAFSRVSVTAAQKWDNGNLARTWTALEQSHSDNMLISDYSWGSGGLWPQAACPWLVWEDHASSYVGKWEVVVTSHR